MKPCFIIVLSVVLLAVVCTAALENLDSEWEHFKKNYGKSYDTPEEEVHRKEIFKKNVEIIKNHNKKYAAGKESYKKGINQFTDCTDEEFSKKNGLLKKPKKKHGDKHYHY